MVTSMLKHYYGANTHGENLLEWASENNINFINTKHPTYIHAKGQESALDVSMVSDNLSPFVREWKVDNYLYKRY